MLRSLVGVALAAVSCGIGAEPPRLLVDFEKSTPRIAPDANARPFGPGHSPNGHASVNGIAIFNGEDDVHGWEIWRTDGSAAGTHLLLDLAPGLAGSYPENFVKHGERIYFEAYPAWQSHYSYVTDGSANSTRRVIPRRIQPLGGPVSSVKVGERVLLAIPNQDHQLWIHDQSQPIAEPVFGQPNTEPFDRPRLICEVEAGVLFTAYDDSGRYALWVTDGTAAATRPVTPEIAGVSFGRYVGGPVCVDGRFFFTQMVEGESQLWQTDGTLAGTRSVNFPAAPDDAELSIYGHTAQTVYFGWRGGPSGMFGGPYALDVLTEQVTSLDGLRDTYLTTLVDHDQYALFGTPDEADVRQRLISAEDSHIVELANDGWRFPYDGTRLGHRAGYFGIDNAVYATDGTPAGTRRLTQPFPRFTNDTGDVLSYSGNILPAGGDVVIRAPDYPRFFSQLLLSAGGVSQAELLINTIEPGSHSFPYVAGAANSAAFVCALSEGADFAERFIVNAHGQFATSGGSGFALARNGRCERPSFFYADGATYFFGFGRNLAVYRFDQQALATRLVWRPPGDTRGGKIEPAEAGGRHLFIGKDDDSYYTLFAVDLSSGASRALKRFGIFGHGSFPVRRMAKGKFGVAFAAATASGIEPWRTDGTPAGTIPLADLNQNGSSDPHSFVTFGDAVLFVADALDDNRDQVYITNGTPDGTRLFTDFGFGDLKRSIHLFNAVDGALYARVNAGGESRHFRVESPDRIRPVTLWPGPDEICLQTQNVLAERVYTLVTGSQRGPELFHLDCRAGRVVRRLDLSAGPDVSYPQTLTPVGELVFLSAHTAETGAELFAYDAVTGDLVLVADIRPGPESSSPGHTRVATSMGVIHDDLIFAADATGDNRELWASPATGVRLQTKRNVDGSLGVDVSLSRPPTEPVKSYYQVNDLSGSVIFEPGETRREIPLDETHSVHTIALQEIENGFPLSQTLRVPTGELIFADGFGGT